MKHAARVIEALVLAASLLAVLSSPTWAAAPVSPSRLTLGPVDREPESRGATPSRKKLDALRRAVADTPGDRRARFELIRALMKADLLEEALQEAEAWRARDAYHLVVVRLVGDILSELGRGEEARRVYSAVVELLPRDPHAHRAVATVMKQSGDIQGAYTALSRAAELSEGDPRLLFELADAAQRRGRFEEARERLERIVADESVAKSVRYPATQRLGQALSALARAAEAGGDPEQAASLRARLGELKLKGGVENDLKVYLTWDTDRSDVDLWVVNPPGEKVFYSHRKGRFGGQLFDDVTSGYGPESFTAHEAARGTYTLKVNLFDAGRGGFQEARGEVLVVLDEGRPSEQRHVLPYRLFRKGQVVTVAKITVR